MAGFKKNLTRAALKAAKDYSQIRQGRGISKQEKKWGETKKLINLIRQGKD